MIRRVVARAYANIALVKYWGKQPGLLNSPATPSISLTLKELKTETIIEHIESGDDRFVLNNKPADINSFKKLNEYLNFWRANKLIEGNFSITSLNNFPTKSGLASSSSGLAALAAGLRRFSRRKISVGKLSKLARIGSGSAARSIVGGLAALPNTADPSARLLIPSDEIPWGMVIFEVDAAEKEIGSRTGMELSRKFSPYYDDWLKQAKKDYKLMLKLVAKMDFTRIGEIAEANALSMHACMIATRPALLYWTSATIDILQAVKKWRDQSLECYATIDAGPHVAVLGKFADLKKIANWGKSLAGVKSTIISKPGEGARVLEWS
jgi:diphosphomevalonate decarboxylase